MLFAQSYQTLAGPDDAGMMDMVRTDMCNEPRC